LKSTLTWMSGTILLMALAACWPVGRSQSESGIEPVLLQALRGWDLSDTLTVSGIRLEAGKDSAETAALEEVLLSAAIRSGMQIRAGAGIAGGDAAAGDVNWSADALLPRDWRTLPGDLLVSGRLRVASPWVYLQLAVTDSRTGTIRTESTIRIAETDVGRLAAAREQRRSGSVVFAAADLDMELHLLVRRDEDGFQRLVDWEEGIELEQGDRLQLRFRSSQDCEVFAFLYQSEGANTALHNGTVFANRWIYAPGENSWKSMSVGNEVYTLYFLAARRLEEDKSSMWEQLTLLQEQGRVEKFRGLEMVDTAVAALVQRTAGADSVVLSRGSEGIERGESERFVYADGVAFDSQGELLPGAVIARAYSFEVQYR
jgi:hypothetical protein